MSMIKTEDSNYINADDIRVCEVVDFDLMGYLQVGRTPSIREFIERGMAELIADVENNVTHYLIAYLRDSSRKWICLHKGDEQSCHRYMKQEGLTGKPNGQLDIINTITQIGRLIISLFMNK